MTVDNEAWHEAQRVAWSHRQNTRRMLDTFAQYSAVTGRCNRERAEQAVIAVYRAAQLPVPRFIWHDSPIEAAKTVAVLRYARSLRSMAKEFVEMARGGGRGNLLAGLVRSELGSLEVGFPDYHLRIGRALQLQAMNQFYPKQATEWFRTAASAAEFEEACAKLSANAGDAEYPHALYRFYSADPEPSARYGPDDSMELGIIAACQMMGVEPGPTFDPLLETMQECGWWWPLIGICVMCERPTELHFDSYELHRIGGPAVVWPDGSEVYFIRDVPVPRRVACGEFGAADIEAEPNAELRMAMLVVYGLERYAADSGLEVLQEDSFGALYYKAFQHENAEGLCFVRVKNSTPEPDGSFKTYILRVPPHMRTAREAVAWTFGMDEDEYAPKVET